MCTVSVVPHSAGVRLISNRDERRSRPAARPPAWQWIGPRRALFPVDTHAGGTWIGANDAGVAIALLNRAERAAGRVDESPSTAYRSRGAIVPLLLASSSLPEVLRRARWVQRTQYLPFRLIAVCDGVAAVLTAGPRDFHEVCLKLDAPLLLTSSSLGDALVDGPRRQLFASVMDASADAWLAAQQRFHAHQWPSRPDVSVVMTRPDARTVSRTTCDIARDGRVRMAYEPMDDVAPVRLAS